MSAPTSPLPVRCRGITNNGSACKRIPANGEPYCWQHARDFRHGWNALSTNSSILFGLAVIGTLIAAISLPNVLMSPPWSKPQVSVAPAPIAEPAYAVTWDIGLIAKDHRTTFGAMWIKAGKELFPANVVTFLTIVNRRNFPTTIRNYKVEMQTNQGTFVRLNELSINDANVYGGNSFKQSFRFADPSVFLEKAIAGRIEAYGNVRGWALFQYPKDIGTRFEPTIRVTISDYNNTTFTTPALRPVTEKLSQEISMGRLSHFIDLSHLPIRYVDELGREENTP
jgi:hypothetical protein